MKIQHFLGRSRCRSIVLAFAVLAATLSGCGGGTPRGAVQGTVSWQGTPIEDGTISFVSVGTGAASAAATTKIVGGKYSIPASEGPGIGSNQVQILGIKKLGQKEAGPPHPPGKMIEVTEQYIPTEYNNTSKLTFEIQAGANTADFALPK